MTHRLPFRLPLWRSPATFVLLAQSLELGVPGKDRGGKGFIGLPRGVFGPAVPGEISHYELTDRQALAEAIGTCLDKADRAVHRAHLAIEGAIIRNMVLPLPYLPSDAELATAVRTEVERYALFAGSEVTFDFTVLHHDPEAGVSLLFAAIRRSLVDELVEVFAEQGIELMSLEPAPLALVRSLVVDHAGAFEADEACGVLASLPYELFVSQWKNGELAAWRSIYAHTDTLKLGDLQALADVQVEVRRTLREMPARNWLVVEAPGPIEEVLASWPDTELTPSLYRFDEAAMRGALTHQSAVRTISFNLLPTKAAGRRSFTRNQIVAAGVAAAMFAGALGLSTLLDDRVHHLQRASERLQEEMNALQLEAASLGTSAESDATLAEGAQHRTALTVELFEKLRELTPADTWLTEVKIQAGSTLQVSGMALARTSPMAMALAFSQQSQVLEVRAPNIQADNSQGLPLFQFQLTATLRELPGGTP